MVQEQAIIFGYCFISAIFGYFSIELGNKDTVFDEIVSKLFFSMSLLFINFVMYNVFLIVQNTTTISYLNNFISTTALQVIMWVTIVVFFSYFLFTLLNGLSLLYEAVMQIIHNNRGRG